MRGNYTTVALTRAANSKTSNGVQLTALSSLQTWLSHDTKETLESKRDSLSSLRRLFFCFIFFANKQKVSNNKNRLICKIYIVVKLS